MTNRISWYATGGNNAQSKNSNTYVAWRILTFEQKDMKLKRKYILFLSGKTSEQQPNWRKNSRKLISSSKILLRSDGTKNMYLWIYIHEVDECSSKEKKWVEIITTVLCPRKIMSTENLHLHTSAFDIFQWIGTLDKIRATKKWATQTTKRINWKNRKPIKIHTHLNRVYSIRKHSFSGIYSKNTVAKKRNSRA